MEETKNNRKLRPRKKISYRSEKVGEEHGEHRPSGTGRRPYGDRPAHAEHRSNGEGRSFGEHRNNGESRSYGENRNFSGNRSFGGHKPSGAGHRSFADKPAYGERRSNGEGRSYGEHRSYGEGRNFGEHRNNGESRSYGEKRNFGERRNFGQRGGRFNGGKGPGRNYDGFNKSSEEGIDRMISRKPAIDYGKDGAAVPQTAFKEEMRLNKFIANSGVCSRREADTLIQAGVVTVNGEVVTELGTKVNVTKDEIRFNGEKLKGEDKVYIVMNKPRGYVTTASDPHADKTVMDLLKGCNSRVFPVGRLDKATTGVLMFTNDGEIAERLTHPSYDKKKIYQVCLDRELSEEDFHKILEGVTLADGEVAADELEYIDEKDHRKLGIEIHSGKNRIVRRIFDSLGYDVRALDRVYFAGLTKKGLKKGEWRVLTEGEVNILKMGAYV